ncbi:hypothetical protein [Desulfosporosinus fructosivorans]
MNHRFGRLVKTEVELANTLIEIGILSSLSNGKRKKVYVYRSYMDIFTKDKGTMHRALISPLNYIIISHG